ncbi:MAG: TIGR03936 family radical SAM-associated protein [Coriobacteriia bacterium]|nr:TIGR03936 family radical SAM-associated protein [Coriobacteriia bacterium]
MNPTLFRLRIAYAKQHAGRYLSHLEVQRYLTRLVRRSGLPYATSQGFNPQMRLATGPALGVGVAGVREYADLTLTAYVKPVDALRQLQQVQTDYLPILEVAYVSTKEPSLNAAICAQALCITVEDLAAEGAFANMSADALQEQLQAGLAALRAHDTLEVEHKGTTKVFDSATHVPKDVTVTQAESAFQIQLTLRISQQGSLRPDALLRALWQAAQLSAPCPALLRITRQELFVASGEGDAEYGSINAA